MRIGISRIGGIFCLVFCGLSLSLAAETRQIQAESRITDVTIYRTQAMVVREVSVPDGPADYAVELGTLPQSIMPGTIFASSKELKVRSVRFMTEHLSLELPQDKFSQIENSIKEAEVSLRNVELKRAKLKSNEEFIGKIENQYVSKLGPTTKALTDKEVGISGFDFKTIAEMSDFVFKSREQLTAETMTLDAEERKLIAAREIQSGKLTALRREFGLDGISAQQTEGNKTPDDRNTAHKAIIYVTKEKPGAAKLSVSYIVENASWTPAYNMRVTGAGKELNLEYIAHVKQTTGEDWNTVNLTLSTATPSMNAEIPILAPMWVKLMESAASEHASFVSISTEDNLLAKTWTTQTMNAAKFKLGKDAGEFAGNVSLNVGANDLQCIEFRGGKEMLKRWYRDVHKINQQMAVEYPLPGAVTLASRNDHQMVQILSKSLACSLYYEAVPLLAGFVSRGVEAVNTISQPLLAGGYSAFADGQYVGEGKLPVIVTGQTIALGFGIDPQLRCGRELLDKTASKSWGERTETYKYRLTIDNYKQELVTIRLLDRIPVTKNKGLRITVKEGFDTLCKELEYQEFELPKGILRWDVNLPASSSGAKATKFDYAFDMEFDSDMRISAQGQEIQEQLRNDLFDLERRRMKK